MDSISVLIMQNEVRGIRDKVRRKKGAHSLINIYKEPIRLLH